MSDGTLSERERLVYSAKLAEQAERYDGTTLLLRGFF
jgi:14-3-3 protein epsilon